MPRHVVTHPRTNPTCTAPRHGTIAAHRYGCRCPEASERKRVRDKRRREHRYTSQLVDGAGTAHRVQALGAIGWRYRDLAERLDCTWQYIQHLSKRTSPTVHRRTAAAVARIYGQLKHTPGPSAVTAARAAAKGWHPPAWWDAWGTGAIDLPDPEPEPGYADPVRVRRALVGEAHWRDLNSAEREAAYRRMDAAGWGRNQIARTLHVSGSTLTRFVASLQPSDREEGAVAC